MSTATGVFGLRRLCGYKLISPSPDLDHRKSHTSQGLRVGLHTHTMLGGYSHLSWFNGRQAITGSALTVTSKGVSQCTNCRLFKIFKIYPDQSEPWT